MTTTCRTPVVAILLLLAVRSTTLFIPLVVIVLILVALLLPIIVSTLVLIRVVGISIVVATDFELANFQRKLSRSLRLIVVSIASSMVLLLV